MPDPVPFDLVIFDCDGVLIDSEMLSVRADIECLAESGIEISAEEILERYTGISLADMLRDLETRFGRRLPQFANSHARLRALFEAELQPIAGVIAVVDALPCRRCVASSGTPERLAHALSQVGLYECFCPNIFSATEVARGKPAPDLFLHAAGRMGVAPARCVVVEDSLPGITAAVAAGMTAIGFTGGSHCRAGLDSRLRAAGASVVINTMREFLPILSCRIESGGRDVCRSAPSVVPPNACSG
jgi:HAD superfamily hydrolase (TIGR01509 family)